ncbi:MAG TPA: hypothetical protein VF062_06885 [Candidatus Limnocylindrales bacterium]
MPRRRKYLTLALIAATLAVLGLLVPAAVAKEHAQWINPAPTPTPTVDAPTDAPAGGTGGSAGDAASVVNVDFQGEFLGWAMQDSKGALVGENMTETSSTESMVKTWLVADFLRQHTPSEYDLYRAGQAIRWSDDNHAQVLYEANGGDESIERMIEMCGLKDTTVSEGWWSRTQMSPRDAVALGRCLADGTAAGATWTPWLINEMRHVEGTTAADEQWETRGGGRWGIIDGVPASSADTVAIKNGWTSVGSDGSWHLNCLAFTDEWTMSIMMRYPSGLGLDYGAGVCETIAAQLLQ